MLQPSKPAASICWLTQTPLLLLQWWWWLVLYCGRGHCLLHSGMQHTGRVHFLSVVAAALGSAYLSTPCVVCSCKQAELVPNLVHTVFGFSKDWCASGLRVGVLHTRNTSLLSVMDNYCYFHTISTPALWALTQVGARGTGHGAQNMAQHGTST